MPTLAQIKSLENISEFDQVVSLQKTIWGLQDIDLIPAHVFVPIHKMGGVILGAFVERNMVGFCIGLLGLHEGKMKMLSEMLGVLERYRRSAVGLQLKMEQREQALELDIAEVLWTFDPLEAINATFNFWKLGVISYNYEVDAYGSLNSSMHRGLATDRLLVRWFLRSNRAKMRLERANRAEAFTTVNPKSFPSINVTSIIGENGLLFCESVDLSTEGERLVLEIPESVQAIKAKDLGIANDWRAKSRQGLLHYLANGYIVEDFLRWQEGDRTRCFYLLAESPVASVLSGPGL